MEIRNAFKALFGKTRQRISTRWQEVGGYQSSFTPFTANVYANETCRSCIRTLAEHTSKANAKVTGGNKRLENLLNLRPNLYMNGKDFLYKCRTLYEIHNTVFIYINRDDMGQCVSLYPVPDCEAEAVDVSGELFIKFYLPNGKTLFASWLDLAVLRKDYNGSDVFGDSNIAIKTSLELLNTTNQGMANAIKATSNLRGILKSSKAMLSDEDVKKQKERFVADYMTMKNTSGVAMTDATLDFKPIEMKPVIANYKNVEELRNNLYRYYGMNEAAITNSLVGDAGEAFYEGAIEPFLIALSLELTYKIYSNRQRGHGNEITYESNRMQYMTMKDKLALVQMVDRRAMTPNEWRQVLNLAPLPGGDELQSWQNPTNITKVGDTSANKQGQGIQDDEPVNDNDPTKAGK